MGKRKSKRGAHLKGPRIADPKGPDTLPNHPSPRMTEANSDSGDPDYAPSEAGAELLELASPNELAAEHEPGHLRKAARRCTSAALTSQGGARAVRRLDDQASRQRRIRQWQTGSSAQPSLKDCLDGTLMARKLAKELANELDPIDAYTLFRGCVLYCRSR